MIFGIKNTGYLASLFTGIANGSFGMTIGADVNTFTSLDFTACVTLADVAAVFQTAIRTKTGTMWTAATVTYDATNARFDFVGGSAVAGSISVQQGGGGTDVSGLVGWYPGETVVNGLITGAGAIWASGSLAEDAGDSFAASVALSNNFGSFTFMAALTQLQLVDIAQVNNALNVEFIFSQAVLAADYTAWAAAVALIGGVGLTYGNTANFYPEMLPMIILASTAYDSPNAVQNYMFQQAVLPAEVTTDQLANALDAVRVNYYGQTQTAGQLIAFYQDGVLMGLPTDPLDMNTYANEIWFKDALGAALMTLLLAVSKVSVNSSGRARIITIMQSVINQAVLNGTISVGKELTDDQKFAITDITGDPNAWYQVQTIGYWLGVTFEIIPDSDPIKYEAVYTLVYSKDDDIRKVEGRNTLI